MGFNDEGAVRCCFDIETAPLPEAAEYIEPADAPGNYKDPIKIAAFIAEQNAKNLDTCSLDVDLCRVVAVGYQMEDEDQPQTLLAVGGDGWSEEGIIRAFWRIAAERHLVGFNCLGFDLPVLLRRSLYLGVSAPRIQIDRFRHPQVTDVMDELSYGGKLKMRGLGFYSRRFNLGIEDTMTGADIAQAVAEGRWADVESHLTADVRKTALLAERLGCFRLRQAVAS